MNQIMRNQIIAVSILLFATVLSFSQESPLDTKFEQAVKLSRKSQRVEAERIFDDIIKEDPSYGAAYYEKGKIDAYYKRGDKAENNFKLAIKHGDSETQIKAHKKLLDIMFKDNDSCSNEAQSHIESLNALEPDNFEVSYYTGICNLHAKEYQEAVNDFTKAYNSEPENKKILFYRGLAEIEIKNYVTAVEDFTKYLDENNKDGEAYFWRAFAQYELGTQPKQKHAKKYLQKALADLDLAIKYRVREEEAYYDRAEVKFELGDYEGAIADFKRVISKNPRNMDARYQKAFCYYHYGKEYYAEKELKQIIKMDPTYVDAYYDLSIIYMSKDKLETALSYINKCIELDTEHGDAYEIRAEIYYDLGKKEEACEDIKKADSLGDKLAHKEVHKFCK